MTDADVFARAASELAAVLDAVAGGGDRDALVRQAHGLLRTLQGVHEHTREELDRLGVEHRLLLLRTLARGTDGPASHE